MRIPRISLLLVIFTAILPSAAQRDPVLKQVDVPHRYYYREMYLPQLTTGPSSAAWTPDSKGLIYSMAGSLWRQTIDTEFAEQLTSSAGYDYEPDCSHDGRWVVYTSYEKDAMELWAMNLESKRRVQLTSGGAVNVDPRFSPDGKRIVFVSTSYHGHFHIFLGDFNDGALTNIQQLTKENRSELPRFYYSSIDHEISPAWSPDGTEIVYVSNRGHIYGTGGFWRMKAEPGAEPREIHYEETTWKARPEFSPDGKRLVYASYLGQVWHQLWLLPSDGGYAFPISYGQFDNTNPRWSPDGKRIAFISNRGGNTSLWIQDVLGGAQTEIVAKQRQFIGRMGQLTIQVIDPEGKLTAARIMLTGSDGRAYAPDNAWMHAEDNFVRSERKFESHYFHTSGESLVTVPVGQVTLEVTKGLEYRPVTQTVTVDEHKPARVTIKLQSIEQLKDGNLAWVSGDLHVHMNYGGTYRNTPPNLIAMMAAENVAIVQNLIVNKEQRIPDISYFSPKLDPASTASQLLLYGQEFHTSYWGHLGLLHLTRNYLLPDYATYAFTAAASLFPTNADVADLARAQSGIVGYVHPFDWAPDPLSDPTLTHGEPADVALELPVDVALGKVDYMEVVGFSDHRSTAEIWYRLLNCGFRLPTGSGTDAMANYASLRGPVGLNRVYAAVSPGPINSDAWLTSLKQGRTFATNGPLLRFTMNDRMPGDELSFPASESKAKFKVWMRSIVPVDHLQIICNGKVASDVALSGDRMSADGEGTVPISRSGWCVLRASSDHAEYPVLDEYIYATTSPIYLKVAGAPRQPGQDAAFFIAWIDRLTAYANASKDWNTDTEKTAVMNTLSRARAVYEAMEK